MSEAIRVLVVEDDRTQRELLVSILELAGGIEVCEAEADGAAAFIATRKPRQMKEVYHSVAMAEHTSYECVEKDIRVLVKQVWALDREAYRRVTGLTKEVRRPKNTDFLKALAQAAKIPL